MHSGSRFTSLHFFLFTLQVGSVKKKITAYTDVTADSARLKTNVSKVTKTQQIQPIRELLKGSVIKLVLLSIMALRCCFKSLAGSIHHLIYSFHESIREKVDRKIEKIYPYILYV